MPTKRKQKSYSFNPFDHSWFGGDMEFNPSGALSAWDQDRKEKRELKVIKGLLAKQKAKEASPEEQNKRLGILEHDEGGEYTDEENAVLVEIAKEIEGDSTDFETVRAKPQFEGTYDADQEAFDLKNQYAQYRTPENPADSNQVAWDSQNQDPIRQNERQLSAPAETASPKSKMSPAMKKYAVGLLKDFLTPQEDDPVPQVRGAGIIRGGGTPFPSLLAQKQKPPRYTPKGLI